MVDVTEWEAVECKIRVQLCLVSDQKWFMEICIDNDKEVSEGEDYSLTSAGWNVKKHCWVGFKKYTYIKG